MTRRTLLLTCLTATLLPAAGFAQAPTQRAGLVTRLGNDTIAIERLEIGARELRAEVLLRSPRTTLHVYRMTLDEAGLPLEMVATRHDPAAGPDSPALARQVTRFGPDSVRVETASGDSPGTVAVEGGRDVLPFIDMVHWPFELMLLRAHAARQDSLVVPLLAGRRTMPFVVRRVGTGEYTLTHPFRGTMRAWTNDEGRLARLDAAGTTRALVVERVADLDLPSLARAFAARPPVGELSGRGEASATIASANIAVDYGRPAKRGREIFGALVPYGQVWRTGANRATHFSTDRDLVLGGTRLPAGTYTLFSIPRADGWTLIVNRQTDINGTAYDPAHDLARIEIATRTLPDVVEEFTIRVDPEGQGGVLRFQWDRTEAYIPFQVAPAR